MRAIYSSREWPTQSMHKEISSIYMYYQHAVEHTGLCRCDDTDGENMFRFFFTFTINFEKIDMKKTIVETQKQENLQMTHAGNGDMSSLLCSQLLPSTGLLLSFSCKTKVSHTAASSCVTQWVKCQKRNSDLLHKSVWNPNATTGATLLPVYTPATLSWI